MELSLDKPNILFKWTKSRLKINTCQIKLKCLHARKKLTISWWNFHIVVLCAIFHSGWLLATRKQTVSWVEVMREGLPCTRAVWADLLKCQPLLSRTDHCSTTYVHELSFCRGGCTWRFIENFLRISSATNTEILLLNKAVQICISVRGIGVKQIFRSKWIHPSCK